MKVKVKATGEIVNVCYDYFDYTNCIAVYKEIGGDRTWLLYDLNFDDAPPKHIDWEQRRFELAKAAMQGLATVDDERGGLTIDNIAELSVQIADAVIAKLKEE